MGKIYRYAGFFLLGLLICANEVSAAVGTFSSVGEYIMSDFDTIRISESRALEYAKQAAVEQAGVYVENYTRAENQTIIKDEIRVITSQRIEVIDQRISQVMLDSGEIKIRAEIVATVDTGDIDDYIKLKVETRSEIKNQYYELEKQKAQIDRKLRELKEKIKSGSIDDIDLKREQIRQDREYQSLLMRSQGVKKYSKQDYAGQLKDYDEALRLDPKSSIAYNNRAVAYEALGKYDVAVEGYDMATILDSAYAAPYYNRGNIHMKKKEYIPAIAEYTKAIEMKHEYAMAYGNRGVAYASIGNSDRAIRDFKTAIDLDPYLKEPYYNLVLARAKKNGKLPPVEIIW